MLSKTEALVLHTLKYGEQKLIVDMFTRQHGRLSFLLTIPKTVHGKLRKQYFQPLTMLMIESDVRQQLQLQKLRDAVILSPLPTLLSDPSKLSICLFLSEFLYHALKGEQRNEPLFDYVTTSLQWLDSREQDYANFHLVFLMHLTRFLGFYPNLEEKGEWRDENVGRRGERMLYFDLQAASFCTSPPLHRDFLMPEEAAILRLMMRMDFPTMHLFRLSRQQRDRCIEVALLFYRLHLPDFPDLRSLNVLKELWE
jgi:DNA repair protein RecO (recombination protein O)